MGSPSPRKKLLTTLLAPLLALGSLELGLRLFGFRFQPGGPLVVWNSRRDAQMAAGKDLHRVDPVCLWAPRPQAIVPHGPKPPWSTEPINAEGFRGPPLGDKPEGARRVALLGEPNAFGFGLPYGTTCAAFLVEELGPGHQVLNAAVTGYTVHQGLLRYRDRVRALQPDVVVVSFGFVNEHAPAVQHRDVERLAEWAERGSPGHRARTWMDENLRLAQAVRWWRVSQLEGGVEAYRREVHRAANRRRLLRETAGQPDWPGVRRSSPEEYEAGLEELVAAIQADGAQPILVQLVGRPEAHAERPVLELYRAKTRRVAERTGAPLVDLWALADAASQRGEPGIEALLQGEDLWHLNPKGHRIWAAALAQAMREAGA